MNKWILKNLFCDLFKIERTEDERLEWHYFQSVELPDWWEQRWYVRAFQQCVQWTRAKLWRNDETSDDDIPF
jgi:hypothetical protein